MALHLLRDIRTIAVVAGVPLAAGVSASVLGAPTSVTFGVLCAAVTLVARRAGRESAAYSAVFAIAVFDGVLASHRSSGRSGSGGRELLAMATLLACAIVGSVPRRAATRGAKLPTPESPDAPRWSIDPGSDPVAADDDERSESLLPVPVSAFGTCAQRP